MISNINFIILLLNFIANILISIFLFENFWLKLFLILITSIIVYFFKYPRKRRFRKLSLLRKYKNKNNFLNLILKTKTEHVWNISVLSSFVLVFIIGFFLLRYKNVGRDVDLKEIFYTLYSLMSILSLNVILLNAILFINIILIYIFISKKITKYYKYHFMKRHFYSMSFSYEPYNVYTKIIYEHTLTIYNKITSLIFKFVNYLSLSIFKERLNNLEFQLKIIPYESKLNRFLLHLIKTIHYYVLIFVLLSDLYYNNFHLIYLYKILPFVFIYDLVVRYFRFVIKLSVYHDALLKIVLYNFDYIDTIHEGNIYFKNDVSNIDLNDFTIAVNVYMEADFNKQAIEDYEHRLRNEK